MDQLDGPLTRAGSSLVQGLLAAAAEGLELYTRQGDLQRPASRRLAFRELGLAIGLHAVELLGSGPLPALRPYLSLGSRIEEFWLDPRNRREATWSEHRDINEVMLATSLLPEGWLVLPAVD